MRRRQTVSDGDAQYFKSGSLRLNGSRFRIYAMACTTRLCNATVNLIFESYVAMSQFR